jgi:hypothetical protein
MREILNFFFHPVIANIGFWPRDEYLSMEKRSATQFCGRVRSKQKIKD